MHILTKSLSSMMFAVLARAAAAAISSAAVTHRRYLVELPLAYAV